MNPCLCGFYGDTQKPCTCAPAVVTKYQKRISGPLLDRIDIHIEVPRVYYDKLSADWVGEPSECIRARVQAARNIQQARFSSIGSTDIVCNAEMREGEIRQFCQLPMFGSFRYSLVIPSQKDEPVFWFILLVSYCGSFFVL
jgi:magnesium chelatase family protein